MTDPSAVSPELKLQALQPYLEQLAAALGAAGGGPLRVESGGHAFDVNPWEREGLRLVLQPEEGQFPELDAVLVAEGLALRLKVTADLQALAAGRSGHASGEDAAAGGAGRSGVDDGRRAAGGPAGGSTDSFAELSAFLAAGKAAGRGDGESALGQAPAPGSGIGDAVAGDKDAALDFGLDDSEREVAQGEIEGAGPGAASAEHGSGVEPPVPLVGAAAEGGLDQLALDVAIGNGLMVDVQRVMNALVGAGQLEAAKQLTRFRHTIRQDMTEVQRALDAMKEPVEETQRRRAEVAYRWDAEAKHGGRTDTEQTKPTVAEHRRHRREALARALVAQKRRIALLGTVAVALAVVWAVLVWLPATRRTEVQALTLADFSPIPDIIAVAGSPPSAYLTVDRARWEQMDEEARLKMIRSVGFILARTEYTGALFRDASGRDVGEWLKGGKTRVIPVAGPPPTAGGT